jgi:hypothetical protein
MLRRGDQPFYLGLFEGRLGLGHLYLGLRRAHCERSPWDMGTRRFRPSSANKFEECHQEAERRTAACAFRQVLTVYNCATQCRKITEKKMNDVQSNTNSTSGRLR